MNRAEANISLFAITFFAAVQYVFIAGVPAGLSHFAFLCITNLLGFLMILAFFFGELFRLDSKQIIQSSILSGELTGFNIFMLMGVQNVAPVVSASVLSSYFIFVLIFEAFLYRRFPQKVHIASVFLVLLGLFFMMDGDLMSLVDRNIFYLLIAEIFLAVYVMTVGSYASSSNPAILAMGQMFFCFAFSLILWTGEILLKSVPFEFPVNKEFWVGVIYISFFIRGIYGIIQIYAQRYVSPLNTSLIFSSEIVMTMLVSPLLSKFFDAPHENITLLKIAGSVLIISGLVIMEPEFIKTVKNIFHAKIKIPQKHSSEKIALNRKIFVAVLTAVIYILLDIPVMMTGFLPDYAGIKNALPFITGLFYGIYGMTGCIIGCLVSSVLMGETFISMLWECWCITAISLSMYYGWHIFSKSHRINFKKARHYIRYLFLSLFASVLCLKPDYMVSYFLTGILIGFPMNILFGSLLYIEPFVPSFASAKADAEFELKNDSGSLESANDFLQDTAISKGVNLKRVFEIQSCLEELSIRIFKAVPDAVIKVRVIYYNAISMRLSYTGIKYNPFKINKNEDILDIMSLNIIKHRALRASFIYSGGGNKIHVVM
ncbi:MAG: DMT family transporter [Synergistaceae bacterium]|nr:DMT family transporter [Synergistaceae bacterium]